MSAHRPCSVLPRQSNKQRGSGELNPGRPSTLTQPSLGLIPKMSLLNQKTSKYAFKIYMPLKFKQKTQRTKIKNAPKNRKQNKTTKKKTKKKKASNKAGFENHGAQKTRGGPRPKSRETRSWGSRHTEPPSALCTLTATEEDPSPPNDLRTRSE